MKRTPAKIIGFDQPHELIHQLITNVETVIKGKRETIENAMIAILCGGHILLEDVPGVGKTMLARALAKAVGCSMTRIQFTPDLLPSDITGVSIYNQKLQEFEFRPGPIMSNFVLADEINRTSPRTQAALLEAMEELNVTVDGVTYELPKPFLLVATQNPVEHEGTFMLPEAQLDRFMMRLRLGYPETNAELEMLDTAMRKHPVELLRPTIDKGELMELQKQVRQVYVDVSIREYIVALAQQSRLHPHLVLGVSPRASLALMRASQAKAMMANRTFVVPDDVKAVVKHVLVHRLILNAEARASGKDQEMIVEELLKRVPVPNFRHAAGEER